MANRYVWEKRTPPTVIADSYNDTSFWIQGNYGSGTAKFYTITDVTLVWAPNFTSYTFTPVGLSSSPVASVSVSYYGGETTVHLAAGMYAVTGNNGGWGVFVIGTARDITIAPSSFFDGGSYGISSASFEIKGDDYAKLPTAGNALVGYGTSGSDSAYDTTQLVGGYRYIYSGSDNIDPSAVSSPADPRGGQSTTVTVTPSTGKIYDGTVSYRYEYSVNGGTSWVLIGTTTETSQTVTIPEGSPSFQARVRAQDDLGFTSTTYVYSSAVTVINNEPPTAPGSISIGNIVAGQAVTITLTAATDPDGTVVKYIYERSIDGSGWSQIAEVNALTYTDNVGTEWATVAYRACAVDDDGAAGPYATGETSTVNEGVLYISGPAPDMGTVLAIFTAQISVGVSGSAATDVALYVDMDGQCLYDGLVDTGETVPIEIDTRLLSGGNHVIAATASKGGYVQASALFKFSTASELSDGGLMMQFSDRLGRAIFPRTVAAAVEGLNVPMSMVVTLSATSWAQDGSRYSQTVTVEAVKQRSPIVLTDCALSDDGDANAAIIEAWALVMQYPPKQADGSLTFYATEIPGINIPVTVGVF